MQCGVSIHINASPSRVWSLLTNAADFPRWNSTVTSVTGQIAQGQPVTLRVPDSTRAFKVTVTEFDPPKKMVWASGFAPMFHGVRTFTLGAKPDSSTDFEMVEVFSGLMLPMIKGSLPDFAPSFERYAADLKREAERSA